MVRGGVGKHVSSPIALGGLAHRLVDALDGACQPIPVTGRDFFYVGAGLPALDQRKVAGSEDLRVGGAAVNLLVDLVEPAGQIADFQVCLLYTSDAADDVYQV